MDKSTFARWISNIRPGSEISLYVHVPFCRRLCWFCACRTQGTKSASPVAAYVDVLKQELSLLQAHLPKGVTLSRLHWGGGTPTLLTPGLMEDLGRAIFDVAPLATQAEFSVEIDPNEVDAERVTTLSELGMNRASIGIQDFDPKIQETIGRIQSYDVTRDVVDLLRDAGINSLNADILFGLPHQTNERLTESVQKLLSLTPDRVALYGYAHVPWMARRQTMIPSDVLPTPQTRLKLFETARRLFVWDGYREIGIDHFATPDDGLSIAQRTGTLRRNFQGYTDDTSDILIGLGASSISRFPEGYAQNDAATSSYSTSIKSGQFATKRGHSFTGDDQLRGRIIEALMCDFEVSGDRLTQDFDLSATEVHRMFSGVEADFPNMVELCNGRLRILPEGRALTRMIARAFDAYGASQAQHSSAI